MMYSFQAWMKAKIDVATRPGPTSGSRIRTKAPKRVEPSTIAASSSSFGTPAMNPRRVQTQNGSTKRDVGDDHTGELVHLVDGAEHDVERDDQRCERDHLHPEDDHDECPAAVEAELRERDRRQEREHDRGDHDGADHDQAVADARPEEVAADRVLEVRERRPGRDELGREARARRCRA